MRRIYILLLCLIVMSAKAQKLTHDFQNVSLSEALIWIDNAQDSYKLNFLFNELEDFTVTTQLKNVSVRDAVRQVCGFYPMHLTFDEQDIYIECMQKADSKLSGHIIDESGQPIAYASVTLLSLSDSTFITGGVSNEAGDFVIPCTAPKVIARISCIGYKTIEETYDVRNIGKIRMFPDSYTIKGVTVKGERPLAKLKGNALIVPVENTVLGKLGYAPDVLAQLPLVSKNNGGYQVVGRGKPLIYVNNRQMRDEKELEEIKSSDIKEIKVDLNPGSQYSAEVGAIIKITTIRPTGEGLGGQFMTNWRHNGMDSWYGDGSLNYRHKRLDVFVNGSLGSSGSKQTQYDMTSFNYKETPVSAGQNGEIISGNKYLNLTGGFNYSPDDHQLFGIRYNYDSMLDFDGDCNFNGIYTKGGVSSDFSTYQSLGIPVSRHHQFNAFYQNEINEKWQMNIDVTDLYGKNILDGHQTETRIGAPEEVNSQNRSSSNLWAVKVWSTNKWLGGTAEWGFELTNTRNEQSYLMLNEEVAQYIPSTENLSKQKAQSLFLTYSHPFGPFNASIGLRYEYVDFDYEVNQKHDDEVSRTYSNLFPSLSLSYNKNRTSLNLSYRTIISRPSYNSLSSRIQYNSSFSVEGGNPELQPTHQHRLAFTAQHRDLVLDMAYNYHRDAIVGNHYVLDTAPMKMGTNQNHDMQNWHINIIYSPTVGVWKPSWMAGVSGQRLKINDDDYSGIGLDYQWKNLISLPKDWIINVNLMGYSAKTTILRHFRPDFEAELSVRKTIGHWQLTAGLQDILNTTRESYWQKMNGIYFVKHDNYNLQGFYLRAVYTFNPAKSKYKGGEAGQSERERL